MKTYRYKVCFGRFTTFHNSLNTALRKARKEHGTMFERDPWFSNPKRDHADDLGAWIVCNPGKL